MKKSANSEDSSRYGRGTGIPDPIDVYVGGRIRARRLFLGMNQEELAEALGLTFQQVQKYEGGANRVSASRLSQIAEVLGVAIGYFFAGLDPSGSPGGPGAAMPELQRPEAIDLIRSYYAIADQEIRHKFLDMVKAVAPGARRQP